MKKFRLTYAADRDTVYCEEFTAEDFARALELVHDIVLNYEVNPEQLQNFSKFVQGGTPDDLGWMPVDLVGLGLVEVGGEKTNV